MSLLTATKFITLLGLLGLLLPYVVAHDHSHNEIQHEEMHHHGHATSSGAASGMLNFSTNRTNAGDPVNYITYPEAKFFLYAHGAMMLISWVFVMPVALALNLSRSRYHIVAEIVFVLMNGAGIFLAIIYNSQTPDLYPNNAHHKLGWVIAFMLTGHAFMGLLRAITHGPSSGITFKNKEERSSFIPLSDYSTHSEDTESQRRTSGDSGLVLERESSSDTLVDRNNHHSYWDYEEEIEKGTESPANSRSSLLAKIQSIIQRHLPLVTSPSFNRANDIIYSMILRSFVILGFVQLCLGVVTATGIFMGGRVFNGLAHFIKGGIFLMYGVLTLGRWLGAFSEFGWAWNVKPPSRSKWLERAPTAEMVESSLIFLYGLPNIFLEHLAGWGKEWSHGDLEHLAIAMMFFGGGLVGILVESKTIRNLLDSSVSDRILLVKDERHSSKSQEQITRQRSFYNPFPALVIFILGQVMGSHHQDSVLSTVIHGKWGLLLSCAGVARLATYVLLHLSPPKGSLPSRPLTELITSGCLMAGGLLFMASNRETVVTLEQRGYDAGFIYTLTIGFTAVLMSWITVVMAIKAYGRGNQSKRH